LDFHRTAINAAAAQKREAQQNITSQPQDMVNGNTSNMDTKTPQNQQQAADPFQHDANDAANGLFLLAQARQPPQGTNQYAMAQQQPVHSHPQPNMNNNVGGNQSNETSPTMDNHNGIGSMSNASGRGMSEMSGYSDEESKSRPTTRGKGKKAPNSTNGRRKAEDTPTKGPAAKKSKGNNGNPLSALSAMEPEPPSEEEPDMNKDEYNANGKKMTDEEKRKNFLERNRVAALKCRQRKKQWLANLQQKVELYSAENDNLSSQLSALRDEVVNLKTLLLAHKDCPVTQSQGIHSMQMNQIMGEYGQHQQMNPYGMAGMNGAGMNGPGMNGQQVMAGPGMPGRRFS